MSKTKKSNHKHIYKKVILNITNFGSYGIGDICTVCGKIKARNIFVSEPMINEYGERVYRMLDNNEILEKYKDLEIVNYKL